MHLSLYYYSTLRVQKNCVCALVKADTCTNAGLNNNMYEHFMANHCQILTNKDMYFLPDNF